MEAIGFGFVLLDLYDFVYVLWIVVFIFYFALSVPRFTDSDYLFGIFQLFLLRKMSIQSIPFNSIDIWIQTKTQDCACVLKICQIRIVCLYLGDNENKDLKIPKE
jgi:hypothetical protein